MNSPLTRRRWWWGTTLVVVLAVGGALIALMNRKDLSRPPASTNAASPPAASQASPSSASPAAASGQPPGAPPLETMEVAQAVMVTVELDFGQKIPSMAEALQQVERRYVPDDGQGRTFAILDAYGEPTADGKLHMSVHVSSEKPGRASLVFKPTGEILWQSRIVPGSKPVPAVKNLGIFMDNRAGQSLVVDGSNNPSSILDAMVQGLGRPVRDVWPDGAEREVTFMYSACGCPVKVMVRRVGERTVRTKGLPVIFPDDPAVVTLITRLMRW